jgi:hypothetical protein
MLRAIILSVCALFVAATVFAQTTRQPQRPIGTGTPALPPNTTTPAQMTTPRTPTMPPNTTTAQPIFRVDDASRAGTLNDRQLMQLNAMTERLQQRYQAQYDRLARLPLAERNNRLMELNRDYANAWLGGAELVLTPAQLANFQQRQTLTGGFSTFNDPAIQRGLNLTNGQIQRLNDALITSNTQLQDITRLAQIDPVQARQAYANYVLDYQNRLNLILSVEQQQQWSEMTGQPFPFPPPFGTGR